MNTNSLHQLWLVTVNWNQPILTQQCLNSFVRDGLNETRIVLVDNGSTDNSLEFLKTHFHRIHYVESRINLGFAKGFNLGIKYALRKDANYVFIVNNDTIVKPGMLMNLFTAAKELNADISSPAIYFADQPGQIWSAGGYFNPILSAPLNAHHRKKPLPNKPIQRGFLTGCALLIRKNVFDSIGFFDEDYFLYYEDMDFLKKANDANLNIWLIPKAKLIHLVSASSAVSDSEKVFYWMGFSLWKYFRKHAKFWQWVFIIPWQLGHLLKTIAMLAKNKEYKKIRSFLVGFFQINKNKYQTIYSK